MNDLIKKIKLQVGKYRWPIFIFLAIFIYNFFYSYESNREKFDPSKFKNIAKYNAQLEQDALEANKFSEGEMDDYESKRNTDLLETESIIPESESEKALLIAMQEGKKLNEEYFVEEKKLVSITKHIYPDNFMLPENLHSIEKLNKSKQQLQTLITSFIEFDNQYKKLVKKYEQSIIDKINNPKYSDQIIKGFKKSFDMNTKVSRALLQQYEATNKIIDFCIKEVSAGNIQYVPEEKSIAFTTDELINKYNDLIDVYNASIIAHEDARNKLLKHYQELNEKSAATFK